MAMTKAQKKANIEGIIDILNDIPKWIQFLIPALKRALAKLQELLDNLANEPD